MRVKQRRNRYKKAKSEIENLSCNEIEIAEEEEENLSIEDAQKELKVII